MLQTDEWVSAEFQRLAEIVNEYDSHLWLEWIPPEHQIHLTDKSKVFRIVDDRNNNIVLYADSLANPVSILERLWSMDQQQGNVLARLDAHNAAIEAFRLKTQIDEMDAARDFTMFIGKNTKSRWHHEGRVRDEEFRDLGPIRTVIDK